MVLSIWFFENPYPQRELSMHRCVQVTDVCEFILLSIFFFPLFLWGFEKEIISSFLLHFSSTRERGSLSSLLLFLFGLRARSALYFLKGFGNLGLS